MNVTELYTFNTNFHSREPYIHNVYPGFKSLDYINCPNYSINIWGDLINNTTGKWKILTTNNTYMIKTIFGTVTGYSPVTLVLDLFWMEDNLEGPYVELLKDVKYFKSLPINSKKIIDLNPSLIDTYWISDDGIVWNTNPIRKKYYSTNCHGYAEVNFKGLNSIHVRYFVHRLVAYYFCPKPEHLKDIPYEKLQVNHKDGNKLNNNWWNLEWCTCKENIHHACDLNLVSHRYSEDTVKLINKLLCDHVPLTEISKLLNISLLGLEDFKRNPPRSWRHLLTPEKWYYNTKRMTKELDQKIQDEIINNHITRKELVKKYDILPGILHYYFKTRKYLREILYQNEKEVIENDE